MCHYNNIPYLPEQRNRLEYAMKLHGILLQQNTDLPISVPAELLYGCGSSNSDLMNIHCALTLLADFILCSRDGLVCLWHNYCS